MTIKDILSMMAAILDFDMNLLSIMFFYAFYQLNNVSIGFLVSENIQKLLIYVFMYVVPKDMSIYRNFVSVLAILDFLNVWASQEKSSLA